MAADRKNRGGYKLTIPLDASGIGKSEEGPESQEIKVVARDVDGNLYEKTAKVAAGKGSAAELTFKSDPGPLRVAVGPADASGEEMLALDTLTVDVPSRQWSGEPSLELRPVVIPSYHWYWWWRWCRTFTVRGRVVCPDGSPVPAAQVCAYDVDRWFIWSSTQQVGCATTDLNGAFEIRFRWCCGWWPWWWWRLRVWRRDPVLSRLVRERLIREPDLKLTRTASRQPTLEVFDELLADEGLATSGALRPEDVARLEPIRSVLLEKLPDAAELEPLRIWPWYPWYPWRDCTPDLIFRVTQDCREVGTVIVDEDVGDTRWNIPNPLGVTLVANDRACCRPICQDPPCHEGECFVYARVCGNTIDTIGGNIGAAPVPASLEGYLRPNAPASGASAYNGDRPFGGVVNVAKNAGDMVDVDYYSVEVDDGSGWSPLPAGAGLPIHRSWLYWDGTDWISGGKTFPYDAATFPGHAVYESREHYESAGPYSDWWPAGDRFWTSGEFLLLRLDSTHFVDGTYRFRVVGYEVDGSGNLANERVLPFCGSDDDNELVLTFDNRVIDPLLDTPSNPCGDDTVKTCTTEPDTDFLAVRIDGQLVEPCDVVDVAEGTLEIDFRVHDTSAHLAVYSLRATYKENLAVNLLALPGAALTPLTSGTEVGPTYGQALGQGATRPHWAGGNMRLTVPADQAFPEPCCYQLELRAWKRTVVSCDHGYPHRNRSEYTLGVGVCPPPGVGGQGRGGGTEVAPGLRD